jgi:hypothetical protein
MFKHSGLEVSVLLGNPLRRKLFPMTTEFNEPATRMMVFILWVDLFLNISNPLHNVLRAEFCEAMSDDLLERCK